jgi:hypothetical protein
MGDWAVSFQGHDEQKNHTLFAIVYPDLYMQNEIDTCK